MEEKRDTAIQALKKFGFVFIDKTSADKPVIEVDLSRGNMAEHDIVEHLQYLSELQNLFLDKTLVTDKVLEVLRFLPRLKQLRISDTQITDTGLDRLKDVPDLEMLVLGQGITNTGLQKLNVLKNLKSLDVSQTSATASGLRVISNFPNLEDLALSSEQLSLTVISDIKQLARIRSVQVFKANPSDSLLMQLRESLPKDAVEEC